MDQIRIGGESTGEGLDGLVEGFARYLAQERALAATTVENYLNQVRPFVAWWDKQGRAGMAGLTMSDVTIALWLGHESTAPTQAYLHADLGMKERALQRMTPPPTAHAPRYQPDDQLLTFLESL